LLFGKVECVCIFANGHDYSPVKVELADY